MSARPWLIAAGLVVGSAALAQQAPPPPPSSSITQPAPPPGLSVELADAAKLVREGQYAQARSQGRCRACRRCEESAGALHPRRHRNRRGRRDEAIATFQGLTEDYPELPEPHNNLAVIWAKRGSYDKARIELQAALAINPDYAIAHENLGDVYSRLAGAEFEHGDRARQGQQERAVQAQAGARAVHRAAVGNPAQAGCVPKPAAKPKPKK